MYIGRVATRVSTAMVLSSLLLILGGCGKSVDDSSRIVKTTETAGTRQDRAGADTRADENKPGATDEQDAKQEKLAQSSEPQNVELSTLEQKVSYSMGVQTAKTAGRSDLEIDPDALIQGVEDFTAGRELALTAREMREAMGEFQRGIMARQREKVKQRDEQALVNAKAGEKFLKANKDKAGIVTLPSGLQYKVLKEGSGESPEVSDLVKVNYRGKFIDGTEFDSSYERGEPMQFIAGRTIKAWQEALPMMKTGAEWRLFAPPELAYGKKGHGDKIGPNQALIFDIELLEIKRKEKSE